MANATATMTAMLAAMPSGPTAASPNIIRAKNAMGQWHK
jgi:hypothetical protein